MFSSLSESGFIPTLMRRVWLSYSGTTVLISFREWLHSYRINREMSREMLKDSSHLFQRVASFLQVVEIFANNSCHWVVLISFREWLHSYTGFWKN